MDDTPQLGTCHFSGKPHSERMTRTRLPGHPNGGCVGWLPTPKEGPGMTPEPINDQETST